MDKFLWNLNIEDIQCGWECLYQEALQNYPDGKIVEVISHCGTHIEKVFFNPVECRRLIILKFNQ